MHRSTVGDLGGGVLNCAGPSRPTRPPVIRARCVLALVLSGALALAACAPDVSAPAPDTEASAPGRAAAAPDDYAAQLFRLVNTERSARGLAPLAASSCARSEATTRAAALASLDGPLVHAPLEPVTDACTPASMSGENLSRAAAPAADVVAAWMGSPGHRSNILASGFTEAGIACTVPGASSGDELLCSQVFLGP